MPVNMLVIDIARWGLGLALGAGLGLAGMILAVLHLARREQAWTKPQRCINFRAGTATLPGIAAFPRSVLALPVLT